MGSNSKTCMNASCGATTTLEWKDGWPLRSGGFSDLCYRCGTAYESSFYCETFHLEQSGWRECYICGKRLHCGCIASKCQIEFLDLGGVGCTACANRFQPKLIKRNENSDEVKPVAVRSPVDKSATNGQSRTFGSNIHAGRLSQLCQIMDDNKLDLFSQPERRGTKAPLGEEKQQEVKTNVEITKFPKPESKRRMLDIMHTQESLTQPSLSMNLGVMPYVPPFSGGCIEGSASPAQKMGRTFPIFPKPSVSGVASVGRSLASQTRMARPPVEGRGKNHLLPRYWPRTTDQELQEISGEVNSKVVPLFEKVLSASDAGRIGRLVLPKACAEAYFPSINSSEGIPLRVQDVKGKEWTFQFRFWPNNNSRMYVLEGVTPCIQSMQLQAGDTVTFSRIDHGGKLIMGFRKATKLEEQQGLQRPTLSNGFSGGETSSSGPTKKLPTINGCSGHFRMGKGVKDSSMDDLPGKLESADGDIGLLKNEIAEGRMTEYQPRIKEKKRTRNVSHKSKRMLINNEEATELRFTWEEAQDLLRPPPGAKPTIVAIEGHEFEEYDEPPVFGKRTIFTSRPSGEQEQWAQCDDCAKWRRLPVDALLPSKWTCSENVWDAGRCSCSVVEETNPFGAEDLLRTGTGSDSKKRRTTDTQEPNEPCGLDALASAAVLGESLMEPSSAGATTRHPRHRPGCTCIVCIQPPSGKGKHKPTCTCNVCTTVKRRFKTQMLRRKKRQMEREAEANKRDKNTHPTPDLDETEGNGLMNHHKARSDNPARDQGDLGDPSNAGIDLNFYPNREEMQQVVEDAKNEVMTLAIVSASVSQANNGHRQEEDHHRDDELVVPEEGKAEKADEGRRDTSSDTCLSR